MRVCASFFFLYEKIIILISYRGSVVADDYIGRCRFRIRVQNEKRHHHQVDIGSSQS